MSKSPRKHETRLGRNFIILVIRFFGYARRRRSISPFRKVKPEGDAIQGGSTGVFQTPIHGLVRQ